MIRNITDAAPMAIRDAERARQEKRRWKWAAPCCAAFIVAVVLTLAWVGIR